MKSLVETVQKKQLAAKFGELRIEDFVYKTDDSVMPPSYFEGITYRTSETRREQCRQANRRWRERKEAVRCR